MAISTILESLSDLFNSAFGFAVIWAALVGLFFWLSSKFNPFQEKWKEWEGSIITGIRLAEKQIPNDDPHPGLAKLDAALRFVLSAYAEAHNGKQPSARLIEQIKQGIQIKHDELDRYGGLNSITTPSTRELQS